MAVFVGSYVRILSLPDENYGKPIEEARRSSIGRICRIVEPYEGTSTNGIQIGSGEFRLHYAPLSPDGIQGISFYAAPRDIEVVAATEEMLLLYSEDIWQLVRPFGERQDTPTFERLVAAFGFSEI
ncbi:hypothetical protein [Mesorhizobium sanjuanii]|uniref:hypothetical protein n=1 Tax=Mesorhizobium sanjuanii TaxID=2037900 RepID=UPI0010541BE1|nr:hypothetical protein [Mesorhizobium sanjuanii]